MSDSAVFKKNFMQLVGNMDCNNTDAARLIGIDYRVYKSIMEYGKLPKPLTLVRIADYFDLSVDFLLGRSAQRSFVRAETPTPFPQRYAALKRKRGLTDYAVAQKLFISTSYPAAWKKFGFLPSLENLVMLAELFGVSLDYLLGRTDDDAPYPLSPDWK